MKKQNRISITVLMICFMVFAGIPSFFLFPSIVQTTITSDNIEFQELEPKTSQFIPRTIRVAIYNEPNFSIPSYGVGMGNNNLTDTITILTNAGYQVTNLTTQEIYDHKLKTADYDIFVMADNLPKTNITNYVKEYWLGGGGLLSFDTAICFLGYAGILPPESVGDNGYLTYWGYISGTNEIYQRHPVSKHYSNGDLFSTIGTRGTFDWAVLQTTSIASDLVRIATIDGNPNDVTVLGFDPSNGGGRVVQMPFTNGLISSNMADLVSDAIEWLCPRPKGRILFDLSHMNGFGVDPWDNAYVGYTTKFSLMRDNLVNRSYTFDKLYPSTLGNLTTNNLAPYDLLIINLPDTNFTASEVASVTNWISNGGGLLALGDEYTYDGSTNLNYLLSSTGLSIIDVGPHATLTTSFEHPTEEGCTSLTMGGGDEVNYTGNAFPLWGNSPTEICIAGEEYGNGRIILTGDMLLSDDRIGSTDNLQFSINAVNWLTTSQAKVLALIIDHGNPDPNDNVYKGPVATALNDLGINFCLTFTSPYFNLSLANNNWDLVIVDQNYGGGIYGYIEDYASELISYMDNGGLIVIRSYRQQFPSPLWDYLGYTYEGTTLSVPPIVHIWNTSHRIFTTPVPYGADNITTSLNAFGTDFVNVTLHNNATGIAGLTETSTVDSNAIILGVNGRAISNTFGITEYYDDTDDSTYPDAIEIWENEIAFMVNQSLSVQINSPLASDTFSTGAPSYNISTDGILLDDTWYTLNDGTEYHVGSNTGAINQVAWDALSEGTVSLKFYVEDEIGHEKYQEVTIVKDSQPPTIVIINPIADQSFDSTAPSFIVEILDTNLDQMWYTLGLNTTKHFFTVNGSIVQSAWDLLAQGNIPIKFYANDTIGNENYQEVSILKDPQPPTIIIVNPIADQSFASTAPLFMVEIHDTHLDQMWYTLGSNTAKHFFTVNGSILQSAWDLLAQGNIPITFYANDTIGNENSASVDVIKNIPSGGGIPGYNSYIIIALVGTISIIIIRRRQKKSTLK